MKNQAEQLKIRFGSALAVEAKENQIISIPGLKGRPPKEISLRNLANIIQARMEEIFEQVYFEIKASGYAKKLNAGIVITGGGSQLKSIKQLVEYVTGLDARIGYPIEHLAPGFNEQLKHPMFATGIGLVERAFKEEQETVRKLNIDAFDSTIKNGEEVEVGDNGENIIETAKQKKVNNWWKDIFKGLPEWLMDENEEDFKD
jgi:cell division protein FtsA